MAETPKTPEVLEAKSVPEKTRADELLEVAQKYVKDLEASVEGEKLVWVQYETVCDFNKAHENLGQNPVSVDTPKVGVTLAYVEAVRHHVTLAQGAGAPVEKLEASLKEVEAFVNENPPVAG